MPKLSRTNVLTSLAALAGVVAAAGFAASSTDLGGAALGVATVLVAGLIHSVGRDVRAQLVGGPGSSRSLVKRIDEGTGLLAAKADLILTGQQKSTQAAAAQAEHANAMARRIVADIGAARLEAVERSGARAD